MNPGAEDTSNPAPPGRGALILDHRLSISGIVKFAGDLQIAGNFNADVNCERLFITETASIDGVLMAGMVEIYGKVTGEVYANLIIIRPTAHVDAEIYYRALELDPGSYFEGRSRRVANPLQLGPSYENSPAEK